jgi:type VI secretion system protein ImpG
MADDLLYYYERELAFLRRTGAEFAERYPKVASRLLLEPTKSDDPHVERLLEGFAFLAARVHLRLDDDFPEISDALLNVVYPHYTRPIPSMSLVEFHLDPDQGKLQKGYPVPRGTVLYSRPVAGAACKFRTCYDLTLWPIQVAGARWAAPHELSPPARHPQASGALAIQLECLPDITFAGLGLDTLRFHIAAESALASTLYEVLNNNCVQILARDATPGSRKEPVVLPPSALRPVGFGQDEGMLPFGRRSFVGYRLLQEYFAFPDKFFFLDITGFDRIRQALGGSKLELVFLISTFGRPERRAQLEAGVTRDTIRLGCTPVINLFEQTSEPILLTQKQPDYLVIPDARRRETVGVHSVDDVVVVTPGAATPLRFEPLYSFRHGAVEGRRLFWYATRRPVGWRPDQGSEVWLSFVDASQRMVHPDVDAVTTRLTCHNGALPSRLPFGDTNGDFEMPGGGPIDRVVALVKPTSVIEPPIGKSQLWRLISLLSLNYVSLMEGGADALRELLRLHNTADVPAGERQIQGILSLAGTPIHSRIDSEHGLTFARGHRVEIEFDEEHFAGGGVYLLAAVLERFLGLYVSLNSFCVLAAKSKQRKQLLAEWPPRSGWKTLL